MQERVDQIVLFPRYTALAGGGATILFSVPLDVRVYESVHLSTWMGTGLGVVPATIDFTVDQSTDLVSWSVGTSWSPPAGVVTDTTIGLFFPWMRIGASFPMGTDPGVTFWMIGKFVRRDGRQAGELA